MNESQIFAAIVDLMQPYTTTARQIVRTTDLTRDLNIDSVSTMDLMMEIEDRFDIDIPLNLIAELTTMDDLVALVLRQLARAEAA